jgi:hypothetical protein
LTELLLALGSALLLLVGFAAVAVVVILLVRPRGRVGRIIFYSGIGGLPLVVLAAAGMGKFPVQLTFFISVLAVFATTIGFPFIALRRRGHFAGADRRQLRTDTVLYLVASVLWFAAVYWTASSSEIEGLHFEVASPAVGYARPHCVSDPGLVCTPLTFVEALQFSSGNLVTLGAAGITPLDDATRLLAVLQLLTVFTSVYVIVRD